MSVLITFNYHYTVPRDMYWYSVFLVLYTLAFYYKTLFYDIFFQISF